MKIKRTITWKVRKRANGEWDIQRPYAHTMVGNARGFAAIMLGLPVEAVKLVHRDGRAARCEKRLGDFRKEWLTPPPGARGHWKHGNEMRVLQ